VRPLDFERIPIRLRRYTPGSIVYAVARTEPKVPVALYVCNRGEGDFIGGGKAYDGPQGEWKSSTGPQEDPVGESEAWDGLQREQDKRIGNSTGGSTGDSMDKPMGESTGEPDELIDQFCSSCN
jgi:hypothetical protein